MNRVLAFLCAIFFLIMAFWLGEAGKGLFQIFPYVIGLIGIATIPYLMSKKWKYRTIIGFLFIVFYAVAFYMGDISFSRAYNSCIKNGEQVRIYLSYYKSKHGKYPEVLDDLNLPLPCSRCLRGTILEYESTASNYQLSFKDWLVEHTATDKESFIAHK
ncbi:MAG: hypothetical protein JSV38_10155 [Desulfobacterales bacterium]|nr:MAG: hypothetical protein JSV38_10155 [Desulfobacterales bacterium]